MRQFGWSMVMAGMVVGGILLTGCKREQTPEVTVYTALDRGFSEPLLNTFHEISGVQPQPVFDTESTKTIGLVNRIRGEAARPGCDVFWNNEILNTIRLKNEGLLAPYVPAAAADFPAAFRDPDGYWVGFAARARVFLVNTDLVGADELPTGLASMADPRWRGKVGIAKPLFGTTASHIACLYAVWGEEKTNDWLTSLKANDVSIEAGNKQVALAVAAGRLAFGLTDTDDAIIEVEAGKPVLIVYPDSGPDDLGTLFLPNTVSLIKGAPHPEAGKQLIDYLLTPEVETALAAAESAQIPLNPKVTAATRVKTPKEVKAMVVNFDQAAASFVKAANYVEAFFLK